MALLAAVTPDSEASPDALAHVRLWDAYAGAIYRHCFRRTADAALAEDLTSIVFLKAWRRRRDVSLTTEASLPWLYGVATNVLRNQRRSQRRYQAALARLPRSLEEPDFADALTDRLDDEQRMHLILRRLRTLSRLEQEVLSLCVWEGLTPRARPLRLPYRRRRYVRGCIAPASTCGRSAKTAPTPSRLEGQTQRKETFHEQRPSRSPRADDARARAAAPPRPPAP